MTRPPSKIPLVGQRVTWQAEEPDMGRKPIGGRIVAVSPSGAFAQVLWDDYALLTHKISTHPGTPMADRDCNWMIDQ